MDTNEILLVNKNDTEKEQLKRQIEENKNLIKKCNEQEKEINFLKSVIPFDVKEGEKLMCIEIFSDIDKTYFPLLCKKTQKFQCLEDSLYEKKPNYKEIKKSFFCNENIVDSSKTLEENNIKEGDLIIMKKNEEDKKV